MHYHGYLCVVLLFCCFPFTHLLYCIAVGVVLFNCIPNSVAPSSVTELETQALNTSAIRVSWSSPECPYGGITNYTVFYREADTPQTGNISSTGYTYNMTVEEEYVISGLTVFTNYAIHVQAINEDGDPPDGEITLEVVERTHSSTDMPPTVASNATTESPSSREVTYLIGDPLDITTGRVM